MTETENQAQENSAIFPASATQAADASAEEGQCPKRFVLSVRTKGVIVLSALVIYAFVIALFMFHEKRELMQDFEVIQMSLEKDGMLRDADSAAFHAVMAVFANLDATNRAEGIQRIKVHLQSLRVRHSNLQQHIAGFDIRMDGVDKALMLTDLDPSKTNMNQLIVELVKVKNEFTDLAESSQQARERMSEQYRMQTDSVALTSLFLGSFGLALLGAITLLFFRQLAKDLHALQTRAMEIVNSFRGEPIPVRRQDEVGQLMRAVNSMATALDKREKELLLERQKYFHQEKMAAIGALAAGVAHEIGNPIAAICGIADDMSERRSYGLGICSEETCRPCRPDIIREQAQRLAAITREISEFASPQPAEPQFLDLNAQLRSTSNMLRYDKRMSRVELCLKLDSQLPAIYGVADQLTQLLMNLMINAMDALDPVMDRPPAITISTRIEDGKVCLTVEDNGFGMEKDVLDKAFDAFFTTKPAGKGTGLGLSLCYSIMQNHEGSIEIDSTPGIGTRVRAFFPIKEIS